MKAKLILGSLIIFLFSLSASAQNPGTKKWTFDIASSYSFSVKTSPALADDGTIYIGSDDNNLYAVYPDSTLKWKFPTGGDIDASPAIGSDGIIYLGSVDKNLYAIYPDGTQKWAFDTQGMITSSPAIGSDGIIYVGSRDFKLYAIYPDGIQKWAFDTGGAINSSPSIGADGTIYVGSDYGASGYSGSLYGIRHDGVQKWRYDALYDIRSSPAIDSDGSIYVNLSTNYTVALHGDGTEKWSKYTRCGDSSPVIADTVIYVGSKYNGLYALSAADGAEIWNFNETGNGCSSPLIGSDGTIYFGSEDNKIYALNFSGEKVWEYTTQGDVSTPALSSDSVLYAGSDDGYLYAIHTGSGGLYNSPWPKYRRDMHNNGSSFDPSYPVAIIDRTVSSVTPGISFILDGSGSYDGDGGSLSYQWEVIYASSRVDHVEIQSPTSSITQAVTQVPGVFKIRLKVWNSQDQISYDILDLKCGLSWTADIGSSNSFSLKTSAALAEDGTIYIGSDDNFLYAINTDNSLKWKFETGFDIDASPALGSDGTIYVGSQDSKLYAVNADGTQKWSFDTGNMINSSPAIGADGTIYIGSSDHKLYAINADGTQKWTFDTGGAINSSPSIGPDGTIYVGSDFNVTGFGGSLYAIHADGSQKWRYDAEYDIRSSPAIDSDGSIYVNLSSSYTVALHGDGTEKWQEYTGGGLSSPVIADTVIYVGSKYYGLYALSAASGAEIWNFDEGGDDCSSPLIGSDGLIYFGSDDGKIYALNYAGEKVWAYLTQGNVATPALSSDGILYAGSSDGYLYAIETGSVGLYNSPWPKYRRDMRNNGSMFNSSYPVAVIDKSILSVAPGVAFTLDGSSSYDGDGGGLSYEWGVVFASSNRGDVDIQSPDASKTQVVIQVPGKFKISLKVWDSQAQVSYDVIELETGQLWAFDIGSSNSLSVKTSAALAEDGTIYIGSDDDNLYAINPDATLRWKFTTLGDIDASPAIGSDGTIYVGSVDKKLYAINPDGTQKWAFDTQGAIYRSPAIGSDGILYIGSTDNKLYAIYPDGIQKWAFDTGGPVNSSPSIALDGTIYVGSSYGAEGFNGSLYAIRPDGVQKWRYDAAEDVRSSPAIDIDGTIYVNLSTSYTVALYPDGTEKWQEYTGGGLSSPVLADTVVYMPSQQRAVIIYGIII